MSLNTRINTTIRPPVDARDLRAQPDEGRQTPRRTSFGTILARGVQTALMAGANVLGPAMPGGMAVAAALAGAAAGGADAAGGSTVPGAAGGLPGANTGAAGQSPEQQLLAEQEGLRARDRVFNLQYLELQRKTQEDGRVFQVATNLMKAQHETVKTAINNLR